MSLRTCVNCVFYAPWEKFRQGPPFCQNIKHKMPIPSDDYSCGSFIIRNKILQETLAQVERERRIRDAEQLNRKSPIAESKIALIEVAQSHNLKTEVTTEGIFINSRFDRWLVIVTEKSIQLYHKNKFGDKNQFHFQRSNRFGEVELVARYIVNHDNYVLRNRKL